MTRTHTQTEHPERVYELLELADGCDYTGKIPDHLEDAFDYASANGLVCQHSGGFLVTDRGTAARAEYRMRSAATPKGEKGTVEDDKTKVLTPAQRKLWEQLTDKPLRFPDAADQLNTSLATIRQHVHAIRKAGLPIDTNKGKGIWRKDFLR